MAEHVQQMVSRYVADGSRSYVRRRDTWMTQARQYALQRDKARLRGDKVTMIALERKTKECVLLARLNNWNSVRLGAGTRSLQVRAGGRLR